MQKVIPLETASKRDIESTIDPENLDKSFAEMLMNPFVSHHTEVRNGVLEVTFCDERTGEYFLFEVQASKAERFVPHPRRIETKIRLGTISAKF